MLKLANLFQKEVFMQFIQNILAFTHFKLMIQKSKINDYPICYDKAEQI